MTALALTLALMTVSPAQVTTTHNVAVSSAPALVAFNVQNDSVAFGRQNDELPKCFPYCK